MPQVSIITVCYNENNIERTCQSIINQTFQDFEWIVIDGGSTDGTIDILNKYKNRINILISEKDNGTYNAMNKGIKLANGEWLNFMNGGDSFYSSDVLEKIFHHKKYDADILYGDSIFIDKNKNIHISPDELSLKEFKQNPLCHQASFIKKSLFEKYGLYNENYKICADHEKFLLFYLNACTFKHLNLTVTNYYLNGISSKNKKTLEIECSNIFNNALEDLRKETNNTENLLNSYKKNILDNYYSDLEKEKANKEYQRLLKSKQYTFLEKIFSIKNEYGEKKKYKVFRLFGIKLKIKIKEL